MNYPNNKSQNCHNGGGSCGTYVTIQGPPGPMGPEGPRGEQGPRGAQGPMGLRGVKGDTGCPGPAGPRGATGPMGPRGPQGVRGDIGPKGDTGDIGPQGIQGNPGPIGPKGDPGVQGPKGDKGDIGETPTITVVEDTPLSYKLNFKTSTEDITTPNLFKSLDEYHVDLSASCSTLNIPLRDLVLTYQNTSTSAVRITVAAKDTTVPILTDMRRTSIFNTTSIETQTYNNTSVSTRTVLDEIVYSQSQESHSMLIRQQDPTTKLWSLCEIHSFISNGAARTSIWIQWSEINVSYDAPSV